MEASVVGDGGQQTACKKGSVISPHVAVGGDDVEDTELEAAQGHHGDVGAALVA